MSLRLKQSLIVLALTFDLAGQTLTQTIRGVIIDKQSQSPLPGVVVQVINAPAQMVATSDEKGEFRIDDVPVGRWQIVFRLLGYRERILTVVLNSGKESVSQVELEEKVIESEEVVITAGQDKTSTNNKMSSVSARLFSAEEASRYAGSRNDPARMAANFAGVSGANDSRNDIVVRGNSPNGILWRLNGLDIPNPNHFGNSGSTGGPISILNHNTLDNSDFMTGAFSADYGNAVAGVFDLRMRQGNNNRHEFLAQVGFNGFELGAEGPLSKNHNSSYLLNYRYSTLAVFKALNIDFGTGDAVPQYQDLSFKTDLSTENAGKFSIWGIGGISYVALLERDKKPGQDLYGYSARDVYFRANMGATGVSHTYLIGNNSYLRTNAGVSAGTNYVESDRIDSSFKTANFTRPEYRQASENIRYSFNSTYNRKFNARNLFSGGVYLDLLSTTFVDSTDEISGHRTFVTLRNYSGNALLGRIFTQWQHKFSEKVTLVSGLSAQQFFLNNSFAPEPRVGLKVSLTNRQTLSAGGGLHSQMQPTYLYFATDSVNGRRVETNRQLDFTRAAHGVIAYDNNFARDFRMKIESYYQYLFAAPVRRVADPFSALNLGADFNSPNDANLVSEGTGVNYGIELTLEKFYSRGYYALFTASFFESKYRGSDGVLRNTAFNGNYVTNALAGKEFRFGDRHTISLDARATYSGGKRYTPILLRASIMSGNEVRDESRAYELQYAPYFRLDVKPGYRYNARRVTHEFSIDVQNVTRHLNIFQQSYDIGSRSIRTDYQLRFFVIPQYRVLF